MNPWEQVLAFWGMFVAGWWVNGYPHDDDGWVYPYVRIADRPDVVHGHARRIDPGVALAEQLALS